MEGLDFHTPTTDVLRERGVFDRHPFQPYQGHAIYVRDLAALDQEELADAYAADNPGKLACVCELIRLPDCAPKALNRFRPLAAFGDTEDLLDALTPPLLGEKDDLPTVRLEIRAGALPLHVER
jgi:hypothetical protein